MRASLRPTLSRAIDYAGVYPIARLPLADAMAEYARLRHEAESRLLARCWRRKVCWTDPGSRGRSAFAHPSLNALMSAGLDAWRRTRGRVGFGEVTAKVLAALAG